MCLYVNPSVLTRSVQSSTWEHNVREWERGVQGVSRYITRHADRKHGFEAPRDPTVRKQRNVQPACDEWMYFAGSGSWSSRLGCICTSCWRQPHPQ